MIIVIGVTSSFFALVMLIIHGHPKVYHDMMIIQASPPLNSPIFFPSIIIVVTTLTTTIIITPRSSSDRSSGTYTVTTTYGSSGVCTYIYNTWGLAGLLLVPGEFNPPEQPSSSSSLHWHLYLLHHPLLNERHYLVRRLRGLLQMGAVAARLHPFQPGPGHLPGEALGVLLGVQDLVVAAPEHQRLRRHLRHLFAGLEAPREHVPAGRVIPALL
mmetsp:Transcript_16348/g.25756  ORF Transcript_16348/g.25756 Transcript_16348/m.25756 type:complete len:214 (+) Transcript_16348:250-891(+)